MGVEGGHFLSVLEDRSTVVIWLALSRGLCRVMALKCHFDGLLAVNAAAQSNGEGDSSEILHYKNS